MLGSEIASEKLKVKSEKPTLNTTDKVLASHSTLHASHFTLHASHSTLHASQDSVEFDIMAKARQNNVEGSAFQLNQKNDWLSPN